MELIIRDKQTEQLLKETNNTFTLVNTLEEATTFTDTGRLAYYTSLYNNDYQFHGLDLQHEGIKELLQEHGY